MFIVVVIISHFLLNRSSYDTKLYMTGASPKACRFSNINVDPVIILEYIISAVFAFFTSLGWKTFRHCFYRRKGRSKNTGDCSNPASGT
ncbi:ABC transporter permease subunit [Treponema primitia]|uniref:ABC transporter permease subunit n=1 Tax=Treponema primitia TaxID=88058 RepID=UPI00397F5230